MFIVKTFSLIVEFFKCIFLIGDKLNIFLFWFLEMRDIFYLCILNFLIKYISF